jgi:hypothetical protein
MGRVFYSGLLTCEDIPSADINLRFRSLQALSQFICSVAGPSKKRMADLTVGPDCQS